MLSDIIDPWLIDSQECITIWSYFLCWDVVISYLTYLCINKCVIVKFETYFSYQMIIVLLDMTLMTCLC
jgi:hypothetical protein